MSGYGRFVWRLHRKSGNYNYVCTYDLHSFLGPQKMALAYRLVAMSQGPKNSRIPGPKPLPLPLVMDMHASKTLMHGAV